MTTTIKAGPGAKVIGLAIVLAAAVVFAAVSAFLFVRSKPAPVKPAAPVQSSVETELRNRRLLELNEGIKPVVTAVPNDQLKRLREQYNKRLLELNEEYAPAPYRSQRDQRLYELNR